MINWILAIFFFLYFGNYPLFEKNVVNSKLSIECKTKKINYHRRGGIGELDFLQIRSRSITLDVIADNDSIFNLPDSTLGQGLTLNFIDDQNHEVYKKSFSHGRRRERKHYRKELNKDIENCTYLPKIVRIKSNKIPIPFFFSILYIHNIFLNIS